MQNRNNVWKALTVAVVLATSTAGAAAAVITRAFDLDGSHGSGLPVAGLKAEAIFTWDSDEPNLLTVELTNTSTSMPSGWGGADQLLTSISFDLGQPGGIAGDPKIKGGRVFIGDGGYSIGFDRVDEQLGAGDEVSGEWGYGNSGSTSLLRNLVTTMKAKAKRFDGANLDGPKNGNLNGPQGGIAADPLLVDLGGTGAVADSVRIELTLDQVIADLAFLDSGVIVEFGSDMAFLVPGAHTPEPMTLALLAMGGLVLLGRRRRYAGAARRR